MIREEIIKQHKRGGINTISWHAYTPSGEDSWTKEDDVVSSILSKEENYTKFQEHLSCVAEFLSSLKDENGRLVPVIFRPWHEHNGSWFWWGAERCSYKEYRALWEMTYEFMSAKGLNNLVWAYMPETGMDEKMPEASMFDIFGIDTYQYTSDNTKYATELKSRIAMLKSYGKKFNKPIALTEMGYESIPYEKWWTELLYESIKEEPISYVLMWRNAWDKPNHFYSAHPGHSSEANFKEFTSKSQILLAKGAKKLW